ncbi:hypothetical protein FACS189472_03070 [Alphaproteobacteria bacterium]|nr:hypothetical protein FACS189472_03070 [Alphaproteobacteria bacterium]
MSGGADFLLHVTPILFAEEDSRLSAVTAHHAEAGEVISASVANIHPLIDPAVRPDMILLIISMRDKKSSNVLFIKKRVYKMLVALQILQKIDKKHLHFSK